MNDRKQFKTFAEWLDAFKRRNNLPDLTLEPEPTQPPEQAKPDARPPLPHWTEEAER